MLPSYRSIHRIDGIPAARKLHHRPLVKGIVDWHSEAFFRRGISLCTISGADRYRTDRLHNASRRSAAPLFFPPSKYHRVHCGKSRFVLFGIILEMDIRHILFLFFCFHKLFPHFSKRSETRSASFSGYRGSRRVSCKTRTLARHYPFLVFIITLSQEKSMVKTVEDIAKIAVPLIFLRFRSFLPPPSAASSVSQGHRSVPFLLP